MLNPKLLLVEDEPSLAILLGDRLEREGYSVVSVADGNEALATALERTFDVLVLDVMLPGKNGFEVCRELRTRGADVPILMLTARGEVRDRSRDLRSAPMTTSRNRSIRRSFSGAHRGASAALQGCIWDGQRDSQVRLGRGEYAKAGSVSWW